MGRTLVPEELYQGKNFTSGRSSPEEELRWERNSTEKGTSSGEKL
jgi:hypothetical protein